MTPQQVTLIKKSWAKIRPIQDIAAQLFYERLFSLDPSIKPLFKTDIEGQGRKLMSTLNVVIGALDHPETIIPVAQAMAVRHIAYRVKAKHYDTVGQALLWTLKQGLGDEFNAETRLAWSQMYQWIAGVMKEAAYADDAVTA